KIVEGARVNVPPQSGRKHPHQDFIQIDTTNVLFICGGTFDGLAQVIARRVKTKGALGFTGSNAARQPATSPAALLRAVTPDDLMRYGLIPELVGRLPVTTYVEPLDHAALMAVLTQPRNALVKQFQRLFEMDNVELVFADEALRLAADLALKRQTGARGLRAILESTLLDVMYIIPSRSDVRRVVITADAIAGRARPLLLGSNGRALTWGDEPLEDAA
ncbi:MAG: AAA family ATPase, partial [Anaerolineales bacterium]